MGLDTTHNAYSGGYIFFNRFRQLVAKASNFCSFPPHDKPLILGKEILENPNQDLIYFVNLEKFKKHNPGIYEFLISNDCEGEFSPEICKNIADEMEELLPEIYNVLEKNPDNFNHLFIEIVNKYILGCRLAYTSNEKLIYR
jgi:hypothetical protein